MELQSAYAIGKKLATPFGEIEQKIRAELVKEGFGVLIEINVQDKFKK